MYIVRDKTTKELIHINPAPLSQQLKGKDVYFDFQQEKMEIGITDGDLPEHFEIDSKGMIIPMPLEQQVKQGIIKLKLDEKVVDNQIVEKTLSEKLADGLISLLPTQKITGEGQNERITDKTLSEQAAEKIITLEPTQKITGEGEDEQIVEKSKQEQLDEGLITMEKIKEEHLLRLRNETETFLSMNKTPNGYRMDQLTRQKANFSYLFRNLPDTDETKKNLLQQRLIYPNAILDEIVTEIAKVQALFDTAKNKINKAYQDKEAVTVFESISLTGTEENAG